jgi:3-hydroxyisobutyrate dehydrogenase
MEVGIVGLGKMGSAIAARFCDCGFSVVGWDADPKRLACLKELGQQTAGSAADVAAAADCVITIVSDAAGVRGLYCGRKGFFDVDVNGKTFIEMSTVAPAVAHELAPLAAARGVSWLEAPVMGSLPKAREGSLLALAGGSAEAVKRAEPYLAAITRRIVHMGPAGSGYAMKLCSNLLMASYLQALAEALALGTGHGIALDDILDILGESPVASPWLKSKRPILKGEGHDMSLDIVSLRKDMMAAVAAGAAVGIPMPGAAGIATALSAAVAHGDGDLDLAEHAAFFRQHMVQRPRFES